MPTSDKEGEQMKLLEEITDLVPPEAQGEDTLIIGGDFNVSLSDSLNRKGYTSPEINNVSFRQALLDNLQSLDLCDPWRVQNPTKKAYTWSRGHKLARLDYIFIQDSYGGHVQALHPKSYPFTDHRLISLEINPVLSNFGKGFWRMKTYLLEREDYQIKVRELLTSKIAETGDLHPDIRWEFIKLAIREFSIKYHSDLTHKNRAMEQELEKRMVILEEDFSQSEESAEEYHQIKRELYQLQLLKSREMMLRSRVNWVSLANRPSKYFLNLEKKNFKDKSVAALFNDTGEILTNPQDILAFQRHHFSRLHSPSSDPRSDFSLENNPFFMDPIPPLEDMDFQELNTPFDVDELHRALNTMKNGKSPGSDGIPSEFYKLFWDLVGPLLHASLVFSLDQGSLSSDQKRAVVTLIPKKGRDKRHLCNWRPISVLNVDYKILAKTMALRLSSILPKNLFTQTKQGLYVVDILGTVLEYTLNFGVSGVYWATGPDIIFRFQGSS